jgi:hypothetical protein
MSGLASGKVEMLAWTSRWGEVEAVAGKGYTESARHAMK